MLTESRIRAAKPSDRQYRLADTGGLYLQVETSGGRYWRFNYRLYGRQKTLALGVYPDVSLLKARERHRIAREQLADGVDPSLEKRASGKTFEAVAREWFARWQTDRNQRHAHYVIRRLEVDIFPEIGSRPVTEIPTSAFRNAVKKIEARGALDIAKRVLQTCSQIMRYAVANDAATHNPVAEVKPADILKQHKRRNYARVEAKDLPELLRAVDSYVGGQHTCLAMQLMALTFVRTSELIGARWSEFDTEGARWNIPAERMKMKSPHIVPLCKQSLALLTTL